MSARLEEHRGRPSLTLAHGQFFGRSSPPMHIGCFSLVQVRHTVQTNVPLHTHEDPHFLLAQVGDYFTTARPVRPHMTVPALIFNPAGTTHRDRCTSRTGRFFTVTIRAEELRHFPGVRPSTPVFFGPGAATTVANRMFAESRDCDEATPLIVEGLGLELLGLLSRESSSHVRGRPPMWLKRAVELLRDSGTEHLSITSIASAVGVHPFHLARTARRFLGRNPGELRRAFRLEKAMGLVAKTRVPLSEVALQCGFSDQSQFGRSFKRLTGTSPAAFRRAHRADG